MTKFKNTVLILLLLLVLLLLSINPLLKVLIQSHLHSATQLKVNIKGLSTDYFPFSIQIHDVKMTDSKFPDRLLRLEKATLNIRFSELLKQKIIIESLNASGLELHPDMKVNIIPEQSDSGLATRNLKSIGQFSEPISVTHPLFQSAFSSYLDHYLPIVEKGVGILEQLLGWGPFDILVKDLFINGSAKGSNIQVSMNQSSSPEPGMHDAFILLITLANTFQQDSHAAIVIQKTDQGDYLWGTQISNYRWMLKPAFYSKNQRIDLDSAMINFDIKVLLDQKHKKLLRGTYRLTLMNPKIQVHGLNKSQSLEPLVSDFLINSKGFSVWGDIQEGQFTMLSAIDNELNHQLHSQQ